MGVGGTTLDLVRNLFKQSDIDRPPYIPPVGYQGLQTQQSFFGVGSPGMIFGMADYLRTEQELVSRFVDYEDMDDNPLVASCHDIYSEDATQVDHGEKKTVWIRSDDGEVQRSLEELFHARLKLEERVWADIRTLVKYGNLYAEIVVKDRKGVVSLNNLPPPTVRRIELPKEIGSLSWNRLDIDADTMGFIYDPRGLFKLTTQDFINEMNARVTGKAVTQSEREQHGNAVFESWEVMHCRLIGKTPTSIYGFGVGEPARWIFKRLLLLEDSVLYHRLTRAPSRYAFYIDVSQIPPQETSGYLNKVKQALKKQKFVNSATGGKSDQRFDVLSTMDDFFLPVRDGKESTRVESLAGPVYDHIEDIRYFEDKLFAALKVPRPFLTYEQTTAKTHLSAEDARFARSVMRIQREYIQGLRKVARVHLASTGINPDTVDFDIKMTIPSAIFELAQLEIRAAELDLAEKFGAFAPKSWIMSNVLNFSDEEIIEMNRLEQIEQEGGKEKPTASASGSIDRLTSRRGTPAVPTPAESFNSRTGRILLERLEEMRHRNKEYDRKWSQLTAFTREIRDRMRGPFKG